MQREFEKTPPAFHGHKSFSNPEEELTYLKEQVAEKERMIRSLENSTQGHETPVSYIDRERAASDAIHEYKAQIPSDVLAPPHEMREDERKKLALDLAPEEHDTVMDELLWVLEHRGIMNALSVVDEMGNPHIEDDFHRLLVQYVKSSDAERIPKTKGKIFEALEMTLYEVLVPEQVSKEETVKGIKELLSNMEQFYQGMLSVRKGDSGFWDTKKEYFALEIAIENGSEDVVFYAAVPDESTGLFEKQLTSLFPSARIEEKKDDYNIFNYDGTSVGSFAKASGSPLFPIKTYEHFDHDPLNVVLNAFSKIEEEGEGAAIQFIIAPAAKSAFYTPYKDALDKIKKGESVKKAINIPKTSLGIAFRTVKESLITKSKNEEGKDDAVVDEEVVKNISEKIAAPIFETNIRIVSSAANRFRAERILTEIQSAFHQFDNAGGNGIHFQRVPDSKLQNFFHQYSFRLLSGIESFPLNSAELTTIFHFPEEGVVSYQLKHADSRSAPAPVNIPKQGVLLGINNFRGMNEEIYFDREDRMRHFYCIGQTGTGKTSILKNMIIQDIKAGDGCCFIDPHGNDIDDILANIPKERLDDVIYFDPAHTEEPMGLNMLEYDPAHPEQKTFVVNEMLSIFKKIFASSPEGLGPMFEQYFRNSTLLVVEDPSTGNTLFDISRVLSDEKFRELKLSHCHNPVVTQFWREIATKAGGEASLQNIVPYITSKFDVFLANDIMRPIVAQEQSAFNFRKVMDEKKILLVNLSKGRLGDINSSLLGLIIVGKILMAALSRVDSLSSGKPSDFYLYIDEFQNVTTDSIATILSEARKYRLSLNIAHQFIAQLDEKISDAVFGNVGSIASFRVGSEDASFLESQFQPVFAAPDLMRIENYNAYIRMLVNGHPTKPFNLRTLAPEAGKPEIISKIKELSYLKYGQPRAEIEAKISERYKKI